MTRMQAVYAEQAMELSAVTRMPEGVRLLLTSVQSIARSSSMRLSARRSLIA